MSEVRACCAERAEASMARQLVQLLHRHGVAETRINWRLFASLKTEKVFGVRVRLPTPYRPRPKCFGVLWEVNTRHSQHSHSLLSESANFP